MSSQGSLSEDHKLLSALALAMVEHPRATLQELAQAIGISKASLYRFCRTREQLIERLAEHSTQIVSDSIATANLEEGHPLEALRRLLAKYLQHKELTAFLHYYWKDVCPCTHDDWEITTDAFFLRGQQQGVFRIDIPAPALTELWVYTVIGLMDGERRGRVARIGLETLIENAFLSGALTR